MTLYPYSLHNINKESLKQGCFKGILSLTYFLLTFQSISAYGHYRPNNENVSSFFNFLKENGADLDDIQVRNLHK